MGSKHGRGHVKRSLKSRVIPKEGCSRLRRAHSLFWYDTNLYRKRIPCCTYTHYSGLGTFSRKVAHITSITMCVKANYVTYPIYNTGT